MRSLPCEKSSSFSIRSSNRVWTFLRPENPEEILDKLTVEEFNKDEFLPYWAEHWPASEILFEYINEHPVEPAASSMRICELGSGLGIIASALCAAKGPVCATDISFESCRYAYANIALYTPHVMVTCCDWRKPPFKCQFDMIVGSDILYEPRWVEPVFLFLKNHLKSNGTALIADPQRAQWNQFKELMLSNGFALSESVKKTASSGKTEVEIVTLVKLIG